jgi:spore coat polysaccharide biosynthesis protein SpsF (cytidylyltransferase family)
MSALGIVQARMSSTRLPGKSLADVEGEPLLTLLLRRLAHAQKLDRIVVATSTDQVDGPIEELAQWLGYAVYRGSRDDVLARFIGAAGSHPGPLVRVTADCPLIDPELVDQTVQLFEQTAGCAYASNIEPRTFPDGLDVEVFDAATLRWAAEHALDPSDREHVTTVIRRNLGSMTSASVTCDQELGELRWTVDTIDDLEFVRAVVQRLATRRHTAGLAEILSAVREEPSLATFRGTRG